MSSTVEKIKDRLNITDLISSYVKLEKAGLNFRARCPFHNEKTPSFFVSPSRQSYHCFGCHKGGDAFSFVQEMEGVDFYDALKILAEKTGVEIENYKKDEKDDAVLFKKNLKNVLEIATRYYEKKLAEEKEALGYLKNRGLTEETIKKFRIGFAPARWDGLVSFCRDRKINPKFLEETGLAIRSDKQQGEYYDRFRGRIMFPLFDQGGLVVGFSGRHFGQEDKKEAKYVNTPQTSLYDKSKILYGLHLAKVPIRKTNKCIIVEGQMDLLLSHQAGIENTVAVSGTALTEKHLQTIKRLADEVVMAFDSDSAGFQASKKAVSLGLELGLQVKAIGLPEGSDPADIVLKEGAEAWVKKVENAIHVIDFYLEALSKENSGDVLKKGRAIKENVYPLIAALAHKIDQAHFVRKITEELNVSEDIIWQDLMATRGSPFSENKEEGDKDILPIVKNRSERIKERLLGIIWFLADKDPKQSDNLKDEFKKNIGENEFESWALELEGKKGSLLLEIDILYGEADLVKEFKNLILEFEELKLRTELVNTTKLLKKAEKENQESLIDSYIKKCQDISQAIKKIISNKNHGY